MMCGRGESHKGARRQAQAGCDAAARDPCLCPRRKSKGKILGHRVLETARPLLAMPTVWCPCTPASSDGRAPRAGVCCTPCCPRRNLAATVHGLRADQQGRSMGGDEGGGQEKPCGVGGDQTLEGFQMADRYQTAGELLRRAASECLDHVSADTVRGRLEAGGGERREKMFEASGKRFNSRRVASRRNNCGRERRITKQESQRGSWLKKSRHLLSKNKRTRSQGEVEAVTALPRPISTQVVVPTWV